MRKWWVIGKIEGAVKNGKAVFKIKKEFGSFFQYIWGSTNHKIMKQRGMKFLGSITVYSYFQAVGIVNDHEKECFCYIDMEEKS